MAVKLTIYSIKIHEIWGSNFKNPQNNDSKYMSFKGGANNETSHCRTLRIARGHKVNNTPINITIE